MRRRRVDRHRGCLGACCGDVGAEARIFLLVGRGATVAVMTTERRAAVGATTAVTGHLEEERRERQISYVVVPSSGGGGDMEEGTDRSIALRRSGGGNGAGQAGSGGAGRVGTAQGRLEAEGLDGWATKKGTRRAREESRFVSIHRWILIQRTGFPAHVDLFPGRE